jgi:hypothetical protein
MGIRLTRSIKDDPDYRLLYVEHSETGRARLREQGVEPTAEKDALGQAEVVILAVHDSLIGPIAAGVVPQVRSGTLIMSLDPAAAYAGRLPDRKDVAYFVTHPTHPPLFDLFAEESPEARRDFWGGGSAGQALVCAVFQGTDEDYRKGEEIARRIFRPIVRSHRITVDQMALLEPAMAESISTSCIALLKEMMEEGIRRGVPRPAAEDFILGHITVQLAIIFGALDWEMSDGAKQALAEAMPRVIRPDWKKLMDVDEVKESVRRITGG